MTEQEILKVREEVHEFRLIQQWLIGEFVQGLRLEEIRTHQWNILRCSAMTGKNLEEGLAWVVEDAKKRLFLY